MFFVIHKFWGKLYLDFAVGAPYDGPNNQGAVYIFLGSRDGVMKKPSQV